MPVFGFLFACSFSFCHQKENRTKRKSAKTSWLRGRMSDYRNHSMNSLRSNSISCRFACLAYATQESKKIPIIVHPLKTSSCGMFSRSYRIEERWNTVQLRERQAFSVVGVKEIWRTPKGWTKSALSGQRLESHTKIMMERASSRNQLHPPHIGGGLGGGGCFFASFFAPKKVRNYLLMKKRLLSVASLCESEQLERGVMEVCRVLPCEKKESKSL